MCDVYPQCFVWIFFFIATPYGQSHLLHSFKYSQFIFEFLTNPSGHATRVAKIKPTESTVEWRQPRKLFLKFIMENAETKKRRHFVNIGIERMTRIRLWNLRNSSLLSYFSCHRFVIIDRIQKWDKFKWTGRKKYTRIEAKLCSISSTTCISCFSFIQWDISILYSTMHIGDTYRWWQWWKRRFWIRRVILCEGKSIWWRYGEVAVISVTWIKSKQREFRFGFVCQFRKCRWVMHLSMDTYMFIRRGRSSWSYKNSRKGEK